MTLSRLIGTKIEKIFFNEDYLKFVTDKGTHVFCVDGDCCSRSMFYDFIGVKKLLMNGRVIETNCVALEPNDIFPYEYELNEYELKDKKSSDNAIQVYGYELVTEDPIFGPVTSVFSFGNYSNRYYGGSLENYSGDPEVLPEIFDDVLETAVDPCQNL